MGTSLCVWVSLSHQPVPKDTPPSTMMIHLNRQRHGEATGGTPASTNASFLHTLLHASLSLLNLARIVERRDRLSFLFGMSFDVRHSSSPNRLHHESRSVHCRRVTSPDETVSVVCRQWPTKSACGMLCRCAICNYGECVSLLLCPPRLLSFSR